MATLNQYQVNNTNGRIFLNIIGNPVVEPLDGPLFVEHLMARFPEQVYSKGRDSHLYGLLTALVGDSGAGGLKKKSLLARLKYESAALSFGDLDELYSPLIGFDRLPGERYKFDPRSSTLTAEEWEVVRAADQSYRRRAIGYMQAARLGGTVRGIAAAASAALGQSVTVSENYKYLFDQKADRQIGYPKYGDTGSVSEFIIRPNVNQNVTIQEEYAILDVGSPDAVDTFRFEFNGEYAPPVYISDLSAALITSSLHALAAIEQGDVVVEQTTTTSYKIRFLVDDISVQDLTIEYSATVKPADVSIAYSSATALFYAGEAGDPNPAYYEAALKGQSTTQIEPRLKNRYYLDPFVQKNLDDLVTKMKPVSTVFTIEPARERYIPVKVNSIGASSQKIVVSRFVTGSSSIDYQSPSLLNGKILESGVENEERNFAYTGMDLPVVSMTINGAIAYKDLAISDSKYGKTEFYRGTAATYQNYRSVHAGLFGDPMPKIFSHLTSVSSNDLFSEDNIIPRNDTLAIIRKPVTV